MAVYKKSFSRYRGPWTPDWSRFLVIPRFAYREVFSSKLVTALFVACFVVPLGYAVLIYLRYNVTALAMLELPLQDSLAVDGRFFLVFLYIQGFLGFLLTVFVGPGLISMDLTNSALALYLCRPFSRAEYVIGKMSVLLILLSLISWVPGLILVGLQTSLAGLSWLLENWWIATALFFGAWIWILILSLLSLAISAWFRWKPIAAAMLFAIFFVTAGFGETINQVLNTRLGDLLDMGELISTVWASLFRVESWTDTPVGQAWVALLVICLISLAILSRKLRAFEVVR